LDERTSGERRCTRPQLLRLLTTDKEALVPR
jgi:hypothetical protein